MSIKIAVSGIGGVGGYYGGKLAGYYKEDENVKIYFISRGENMRTIQRQGLKIQTLHHSEIVYPRQTTDHPEEIGTVDYLFCTTKSYDLENNIRQLAALIGPHTIIIPLLNGADITERLQTLLPQQEIWYGCVYIGARLSAPGLITTFTEKEWLWFGSPEGNKKRQHELLHLLQAAGIQAENPEDIVLRIWRKFFLISLSATLTSYYNQSIGEVLRFHPDDFFKLGQELKAIAQAKGIPLPEDIIDKNIADQRKMPYDSTTSMHTDFKNGKRTELETLTGYVVKSGKQLHLPVTNYERMYQKLKQQS